VVQTHRPYDADTVRAALRAREKTERGQKTLYRFTPEPLPVEAVLWCAAENTLVLGLHPEDLDGVSPALGPGPGPWPPPLQDIVRERRKGAAQAWVAGHADGRDRAALTSLLASLSPKDQEALAGVRTFDIRAHFDQEMTVNGTLECADEVAARRLDESLDGWKKKGPVEFSKTRKDRQVTFQVKAKVEALRQALEQKGVGSRE
jgi:hypothetical protein